MKPAAMPVWAKIISVVLSLLMIVSALFFVLRGLINSERFFLREYTKIGNAHAMGMSAEDLTAATMQMMNYMEGRVRAIDIEVTVHGERVSMFNEREVLHLVDVRVLYLVWRTLAFLFLALYAAMLVYLLFRKQIAFVPRAFLVAAGLFVVLLITLSVLALVDFDAFWTTFHHIFFTNDLWLLDPATSRMINMMPLQLFFDIVMQIILRFAVPFAAVITLVAYLLRRKRAKGRASA